MKTMYKVVIGLIIALGLLHSFFTPFNHTELSLDAVWFLGSGLAIIFSGFLNIALIRDGGKDTVIRALCFTSNTIFAALFGAALLILQQPQLYLGLLLFVAASDLAIFSARS